MFMSLISHLLSAWFAFLLPCFSTFKALKRLPHSEPDLKRWAMYWSIVGVFVAFEYVAEWFISWLPFYWEIKTLFLLYLSLPQTQGSTYIYTTYVHPFLTKHELALDASIEALQSDALAFIQAKLGDLFRLVTNAAQRNGSPAGAGTPGSNANASPNGAAWQAAAAGLWDTYGASVINSLRPGATAGATGAAAPANGQGSNPTTPNKPRTSASTPNQYFGTSTALPNNVNPPFPVPQYFQAQQ